MGAVHEYRIDDPGMASAARVRAATCPLLHADFSGLKGLTDEELTELGIHTGVTLVKQPPGENEITKTVPIPIPAQERTLGDQLAHATSATDDTQPLAIAEIADGLTARADNDQMKEHPHRD